MATDSRFGAVIIDLSGVLYTGAQPLPGSIDALKRLQDSSLPHCFLTNTTRQTRDSLCRNLQQMGFSITPAQLMTAASAAHAYLQAHRLRPHLLIHPDLSPEFQDLDTSQPNAVVVGDAGAAFTYDSLNAAFRVLMQSEGTALIAMGANRYFQEQDGLSLDMGPFVRALEHASGRQSVITGKPAGDFFQAALKLVGKTAGQTVMIGDDLENDIGGAQTCGIAGILVRTGKYRPEDENHPDIHPHRVTADFAAAIDLILENA